MFDGNRQWSFVGHSGLQTGYESDGRAGASLRVRHAFSSLLLCGRDKGRPTAVVRAAMVNGRNAAVAANSHSAITTSFG